jgi:hypothetical protein
VFLVVIVNFEPVDLGVGKSDLALRRVLVGALVDLGLGNRHQITWLAYFDRLSYRRRM